jgi:hypothetical protein
MRASVRGGPNPGEVWDWGRSRGPALCREAGIGPWNTKHEPYQRIPGGGFAIFPRLTIGGCSGRCSGPEWTHDTAASPADGEVGDPLS